MKSYFCFVSSISQNLTPSENSLRDCTAKNCPDAQAFPQFLACLMSNCADTIHGKRWLDTGYYSVFPQSKEPEECIQDGCQAIDDDVQIKCRQICHKLAYKRDWVDTNVYKVKNGEGKRDWVDPTVYTGGKRLWVDPSVYSDGNKRWIDTNVYKNKQKSWVDPSLYTGKRDWVDPSLYKGGQKSWVDPNVYGKRDWVDTTLYKNKANRPSWVDRAGHGKREEEDNYVDDHHGEKEPDKDNWLEQVLFSKVGSASSAVIGEGTKKWLDPMAYRTKRWLDPMTYRNNRAKPTPKEGKRSLQFSELGRQMLSECQGYLCRVEGMNPLVAEKKNHSGIGAVIRCLQKCGEKQGKKELKECSTKCFNHPNTVE